MRAVILYIGPVEIKHEIMKQPNGVMNFHKELLGYIERQKSPIPPIFMFFPIPPIPQFYHKSQVRRIAKEIRESFSVEFFFRQYQQTATACIVYLLLLPPSLSGLNPALTSAGFYFALSVICYLPSLAPLMLPSCFVSYYTSMLVTLIRVFPRFIWSRSSATN